MRSARGPVLVAAPGRPARWAAPRRQHTKYSSGVSGVARRGAGKVAGPVTPADLSSPLALRWREAGDAAFVTRRAGDSAPNATRGGVRR